MKKAHCNWLEQLQIADDLLFQPRLLCSCDEYRSSHSARRFRQLVGSYPEAELLSDIGSYSANDIHLSERRAESWGRISAGTGWRATPDQIPRDRRRTL
jgi:hypothetical protein